MKPALVFVVESGTDVRLVNGLARRFALTVLARRIPGGVEISRPPASSVPVMVGPAGRAAFAAWLLPRLRRTPGHVLVQGYGVAAAVCNTLGRLSGRPVTMLVCSPVERYYRARRRAAHADRPFRPGVLAALRATAAWNARVGQRYVVLSRHLADVVRAHGTRRPIHLVPVYGVDTDRFRPAGDRQAVRARLDLSDDRHAVFFSSRVAPEKDAETLLAAARLLIDQGWPLLLVHLSGGHRAFRAAAEAAGLTDDHVLARDAVHPVDDLPAWYQAADLCVQASREEGLGFSPLEALACETPVVATAVGGLKETVIPGETGWTYPAGDVGGLAGCIREALTDRTEAVRRARTGRALVARHYAADRVFADLEKVLSVDR